MPDTISIEIFTHLVELAALELQPEEAEYLRRELNNQLQSIHELEVIPLNDDISVTSHGVPYTPEITPPMRPDELNVHLNPAEIISQAPENEDGYVIVPEIPHIDLD